MDSQLGGESSPPPVRFQDLNEVKTANTVGNKGDLFQHEVAGASAMAPAKHSDYRSQGRATFYDTQHTQLRGNLKHRQEVRQAISRFWLTFGLGKKGRDYITRDEFVDVEIKLCKALFWPSDFKVAEAEAAVAQDWTQAEGDANAMDKSDFVDSLFETVDIWTNSCDIGDYVDFLEKLYNRVAVCKNGVFEWRSMSDIVHMESDNPTDCLESSQDILDSAPVEVDTADSSASAADNTADRESDSNIPKEVDSKSTSSISREKSGGRGVQRNNNKRGRGNVHNFHGASGGRHHERMTLHAKHRATVLHQGKSRLNKGIPEYDPLRWKVKSSGYGQYTPRKKSVDAIIEEEDEEEEEEEEVAAAAGKGKGEDDGFVYYHADEDAETGKSTEQTSKQKRKGSGNKRQWETATHLLLGGDEWDGIHPKWQPSFVGVANAVKGKMQRFPLRKVHVKKAAGPLVVQPLVHSSPRTKRKGSGASPAANSSSSHAGALNVNTDTDSVVSTPRKQSRGGGEVDTAEATQTRKKGSGASTPRQGSASQTGARVRKGSRGGRMVPVTPGSRMGGGVAFIGSLLDDAYETEEHDSQSSGKAGFTAKDKMGEAQSFPAVEKQPVLASSMPAVPAPPDSNVSDLDAPIETSAGSMSTGAHSATQMANTTPVVISSIQTTAVANLPIVGSPSPIHTSSRGVEHAVNVAEAEKIPSSATKAGETAQRATSTTDAKDIEDPEVAQAHDAVDQALQAHRGLTDFEKKLKLRGISLDQTLSMDVVKKATNEEVEADPSNGIYFSNFGNPKKYHEIDPMKDINTRIHLLDQAGRNISLGGNPYSDVYKTEDLSDPGSYREKGHFAAHMYKVSGGKGTDIWTGIDEGSTQWRARIRRRHQRRPSTSALRPAAKQSIPAVFAQPSRPLASILADEVPSLTPHPPAPAVPVSMAASVHRAEVTLKLHPNAREVMSSSLLSRTSSANRSTKMVHNTSAPPALNKQMSGRDSGSRQVGGMGRSLTSMRTLETLGAGPTAHAPTADFERAHSPWPPVMDMYSPEERGAAQVLASTSTLQSASGGLPTAMGGHINPLVISSADTENRAGATNMLMRPATVDNSVTHQRTVESCDLTLTRTLSSRSKLGVRMPHIHVDGGPSRRQPTISCHSGHAPDKLQRIQMQYGVNETTTYDALLSGKLVAGRDILSASTAATISVAEAKWKKTHRHQFYHQNKSHLQQTADFYTENSMLRQKRTLGGQSTRHIPLGGGGIGRGIVSPEKNGLDTLRPATSTDSPKKLIYRGGIITRASGAFAGSSGASKRGVAIMRASSAADSKRKRKAKAKDAKWLPRLQTDRNPYHRVRGQRLY